MHRIGTMIKPLVYARFLIFICVPGCYSYPAWDTDKFPCHKYLDIISDWPDGFRGNLTLPVLESMEVLPGEMKDGDVKLKFNKPIFTLDAPQENRIMRKVKEKKEYSIFIKFKGKEISHLKKGDIFSLDISVHFDRKLKGFVGISFIQFGKFLCPAVDKKPEIPKCETVVTLIDKTIPDGYKMGLRIPVKNAMRGWNLQLSFAKEVLVLDVPQGIRTPTTRNERTFCIQNREYNGNIKANSTFHLDFMVHFDRNKMNKQEVKVSYIRMGIFECKS